MLVLPFLPMLPSLCTVCPALLLLLYLLVVNSLIYCLADPRAPYRVIFSLHLPPLQCSLLFLLSWNLTAAKEAQELNLEPDKCLRVSRAGLRMGCSWLIDKCHVCCCAIFLWLCSWQFEKCMRVALCCYAIFLKVDTNTQWAITEVIQLKLVWE